MRVRLFAVLLSAVWLAGLASMSSSPASVTGAVSDESGGVLPGVTVTLSGPLTRTAVTDANGRFTFALLLPGIYTVRFELGGFATRVTTIAVAADRTARLSIAMAVGALTESVSVSAGSPTIATSVSDSRRRGRERAASRTAAYDRVEEHGFRRAAAHPLSTFSIDVDTASYANVRRFLNEGGSPPAGAVRIEELINYFRFDYAAPPSEAPVAITTELASCPWNAKHQLALVGVRARDIHEQHVPPRNLVFLLDVSGSMAPLNRLPLVQRAMHMLTEQLTARDTVSIVVYAGASGLVLPSTSGSHQAAIHEAIDNLSAGGNTNGGEGIRLAYRLARQLFIRGGVNRVILATDGDFNVGATSQDELVRLVEKERESGVFLSVLGVGTDNLQDSTMEKLADKGNGNYAYLDSLHEASKVLVRESGATLVTVAKDVKIQIEFNPRAVEGYRLIGYENRQLHDEDFNDDRKDAGEMGAGHTVTVLYEIVPKGVGLDLPGVDPLKYQQRAAMSQASRDGELMTVKLRYKAPDGFRSKRLETVVGTAARELGENLGFASAVAEFGMLLRASPHAGAASFDRLIARARRFRGKDAENHRAGFIEMAELAGQMRQRTQTSGPGQ